MCHQRRSRAALVLAGATKLERRGLLLSVELEVLEADGGFGTPEHGLDLDSLVVLVTLLFQEVLEGVAVVDAVDLDRVGVRTAQREAARHRPPARRRHLPA